MVEGVIFSTVLLLPLHPDLPDGPRAVAKDLLSPAGGGWTGRDPCVTHRESWAACSDEWELSLLFTKINGK